MSQENSVSFKVFLSKEGSSDQPEVRRFGIDRDVVSNFSYLREKLQMVFPSLKSMTFTVNWKDADGDSVLISSDEELMIALTEMQMDVRKLYVTLKGSNGNPGPEGSLPVHSGVSCDGCNTDVRGFRYKCLMCPDYDLCSTCEAAGTHSDHFMVRMPVPINWRPSFGRRLSHHLSKSARKSEGCAWAGEECAAKAAYHEGVGPHRGRHHRGHHDGHHGHHGGHHGGPHGEPRCPRAATGGFNWLDTLAGYLSEWTNMPGEADPTCQAGRAGAASAPAAGCSAPTAEQAQQQQAYRAAQHTKYLQSIGETVANLLDPFGIDVDVQIRTDADKSADKPATTPAAAPAATPGTPNKTQDPETAVKEVSAQMSSVNIGADNNVEMTSLPDTEMSSPPEAEGWTVLNGSEQSNPGMHGAIPRVDLEQQAAQAALAAKEAQKHALAAHAQAQAEANALAAQKLPYIYPQLPQVPYTRPPVVPFMGPQLAPQFQVPSQGLPPPMLAHPSRMPNVNEAVEQMMSMGFSNEGGWLTQLLETHNGNITKVLDVLQPVRK